MLKRSSIMILPLQKAHKLLGVIFIDAASCHVKNLADSFTSWQTGKQAVQTLVMMYSNNLKYLLVMK